MAKTKIAVLGGGIAGLSAAYQLSCSAQLQAQFDVTVYQMGWRLGGKIASGRDATGRNIEHGLHVWFGCYDNAFRMLQEVYRTRPASAVFQTWRDALKPQPFTPIGVKTGDAWGYAPVTWPSNAATPGVGGLGVTLWELVAGLIGMLRRALEDLDLDFPLAMTTNQAGFPGIVQGLFAAAGQIGIPGIAPGGLLAHLLAQSTGHTFLEALAAVHEWADALDDDPAAPSAPHQDAILDALDMLNDAFKAGPALTAQGGTAVHMARDLLDIGRAFIQGLVKDIVQTDQPFASLDDTGLEFREWLLLHGADPTIVAESSVLRTLYDTAFQYIEGDTAKPSYAAGTAVGVLVRLIGTYKGDMLWELQSGIGEAVIAPLYEALVAAGVQFQFFHKVVKLELSADQNHVASIDLDRQADTLGNQAYRPIADFGGLMCWGSEPDWGQLVGGQQLQAAGVDFESPWRTRKGTNVRLNAGTDFDKVVLALPLGACKQLNAEPSICQDLINADQRFKDFVEKIPIVPTLSLQLWCDVTTAVLGWDMGKPAAVAGPEPLSVWTDMSQVLAFEPWQNATKKPLSLHYLCGPLASQLFKEPSTNGAVPAQIAADVRAQVVQWLEQSSLAAWDVASDGTSFRWEMLTDPSGRLGNARLGAQYMRANISPSDCCVGSPAGTTQFRLGPSDTRFVNLFIAGEAARSGCNTSSVEGAVMTGMAAARAITGQPLRIVGYQFLTCPPSAFFLQE